jgi:hypothetical protein
MPDHRYDDDEIRDILARATEVRPESGEVLPAAVEDRTVGAGRGLTLAQLREVGAEVGIPAERIEEAAKALELDRAALPAVRRRLGVQLSAAHAVRLPRMFTDEEWDRFVVRLRDTFAARGEVKTEGSLRTWSNGNLQVLLEPLPEGARLRFTSLHGTSKQWLDGSLALVLGGGAIATTFVALSLLASKPIPVGLWALAGLLPAAAPAFWALGRATAGRWLPERSRQFLELGAEARAVVEGG